MLLGTFALLSERKEHQIHEVPAEKTSLSAQTCKEPHRPEN